MPWRLTSITPRRYPGRPWPCDYGAKEADKAKLAGIEIYVIAWGADDRCANDQ